MFIILGVVLLSMALLAYKWTYTTSTFRAAQRRNKQIALVAALLAGGVISTLLGLGWVKL